jgi:hypothetical protein
VKGRVKGRRFLKGIPGARHQSIKAFRIGSSSKNRTHFGRKNIERKNDGRTMEERWKNDGTPFIHPWANAFQFFTNHRNTEPQNHRTTEPQNPYT